ncbi:MAG: glycosyltransferase family 1 protein [Proteobacteria bacterium]|nr:glycosyltransferase family 1 protein [Pseudomonadota bacterium]
MKQRIGILTSHPIQYQAPWFRALTREMQVEVFFAHQQAAKEQADFGVPFEWDVDLLSGYSHRYLMNRSRHPGVNHFSGCDSPEVAELIRTGGFDAFVVSGWYLKAYLQGMRACRRYGVPVLVRGDSQLVTPRSLLKRLLKRVSHRWLVQQFDGFLVVGERNRQYLAYYGVPAAKMFPVPHFVDNAWFAARARMTGAEREALRATWGADPQTMVALFVGKFIPKKRPGDLLAAMHHLSNRGAGGPLLAVMVGSGELEPTLRADAERMGVAVKFVGFKNQTELPACYAAADVLVLPSDGGETWGLVVNEAMACGRPAIVSDAVGCAPDLITPGETGFTFRTGDVVRLAGCIEQCAQQFRAGHDYQSALAGRMRKYSVEAAVAGTIEAVEKLGRRPRN